MSAKVKRIAFTNMKTMIFCSEFIQKLFTKILEATTLFRKLTNEYLKPKIYYLLHFFQGYVDHKENKVIILQKNLFQIFKQCLLKSIPNKNLKSG